MVSLKTFGQFGTPFVPITGMKHFSVDIDKYVIIFILQQENMLLFNPF